MITSIEIPQPDDWHVHLRDDDMLAAVVGYTAHRFRYALVMPNLVPAITSTAAVTAYRERIMAVAPVDAADFRPLFAVYCSRDIDLNDLKRGAVDGSIAAVKYYPAGATTNSAAGGSSMFDFILLFEVMADSGIRLLVHAESTDPDIDIFDREAHFLSEQLAPVCAALPELSVTVEHVSTSDGVDFVAAHSQCAATITPHHLARDRSHVLADGMRPDLYCKPVINSSADRAALLAAATSGAADYMLGTDSAPHPTTEKYGPVAKAGVFNAAYGLEVVAEAFYQAGRLDRLGQFVSTNGVACWGVEPPRSTITMTREAIDRELATSLTTTKGDEVVLFGAEEASLWTIQT